MSTPNARDTVSTSRDNKRPRQSRQPRVTYALLDSLDVPVGRSLVIYVRWQRKAMFYLHSKSGYKFVLARDKRAARIRYRDDDAIFSMDFDGTVTPGDKFNVFVSESEAKRIAHEYLIL